MLQVDTYSDIGGMEKNEDRVAGWHKGLRKMCFLIADGLGGCGDGEIAAAAAIDSIKEEWDGQMSQAAWKSLLAHAHKRVLQMQNAETQMKTTIVGLMLDADRAVWAHIGDSRLYHFQDGKLVFQTKDHSVSQIAVMLGEIPLSQIRFHKDRSLLFRALGQSGETPAPQIDEQTLENGLHAFLLCTDGFWEYVLEEEMEQDLQAAHSAKQWLSSMQQRLQARAPRGNDNNSAIVIWEKIEKRED